MNGKLKKWFCVVFSAAVAVACAAFAGCSKKDDVPSDDKSAGKLFFAESALTLTIGDTRFANAAYEGENEVVVAYVSSAPEIATVNADGFITAIAAGEAVIRASAESLSAELSVRVGTGDAIPVLEFNENISGNEIRIGATDAFDFSAKVLFNGKSYSDALLTFSLSEPIGAFEGNLFCPKSTGETVVTVNASWRNYRGELGAQVKIIVENEVELFVNDNIPDGENVITLYTLEAFGGNTFKTTAAFVAHAYENGEALSAGVRIAEGEDVVSYDEADGVLRSLKYGQAVAEIYCVDSCGARHTKRYAVKVSPSVAEYAETIDFSVFDGDLPLKTIFGANESDAEPQLVEAYSENGAYRIENNRVLGVAEVENAVQKISITVCTEQCGYTLRLNAYTRIIRSAEDLNIFTINDKEGEFNGYYLLGNDIEASGYTHATGVSSDLSSKSNRWFANEGYGKCGLKGTFDGSGHAISNLTIGQFGLFGIINGGKVKNVALKDVKFVAKQNVATLAWYIYDSKIENVYMSAESLPAVWARAMVASSIIKSSVNNVIIRLGEVIGNALNEYDAGLSAYGSFVSSNAAAEVKDGYGIIEVNKFSNVYLISATKLSVLSASQFDGENKDPENCYKGIRRYDTEAEMSAAKNDYSDFIKTDFWRMGENGTPEFNA